MAYWITVGTFAMLYASLAISFNLAAGYAGMVTLVHAMFFAIGAYTYGIWGAASGGEVFLDATIVGVIASAMLAMVMGFIVTMLSEHYVLIGSFALQVIFTSLLINFNWITGGVVGLSGVPSPRLGPWTIDTPVSGLIMAFGIASITLAIAIAILKGSYGLRSRAVREDSTAAAATGLSVRRIQIGLFTLAAALASVVGSAYAGLIGFIDPTTFTVHNSILILTMVMIGGPGNPYGAMLGGLLIATLPALVQEFDIGASSAAALQQMLFGAIMVVMIIRRPDGVLPEKRLRLRPS